MYMHNFPKLHELEKLSGVLLLTTHSVRIENQLGSAGANVPYKECKFDTQCQHY